MQRVLPLDRRRRTHPIGRLTVTTLLPFVEWLTGPKASTVIRDARRTDRGSPLEAIMQSVGQRFQRVCRRPGRLLTPPR